MKIVRRIFTFGVVLYGFLLTLSLIARLLIPETWSPLALVVTVAHVLLLGALLLFPFALLMSKPRLAALLLLPAVLVFLFHYGEQFIPSREQTPLGGTTVRFMSYNLQWRNSDYQDAVTMLRAVDADVVALQEVSPQAAAVVEASLGDRYDYMALNPNENGYAGAAVLSRFPISDSAYFTDAFGSQRVVIDVNGMPIIVYNMHVATPLGSGGFLRLNAVQRSREVNDLVRAVQAETGRVAVLGDFNLTDLSDDYAALAAVLQDSYRTVGWGMGWTHPGPFLISPGLVSLRVLRIDYIFTGSGGVRPLNAQVVQDSGGSDHLPLIAALEIYDPSASYDQ